MRSTGSTLISSYPQRHWYQGDYSELDPETGLQAFDLRMYSSRIGRWLSVDPYAQYWSPYLAMGNNPVGMVDPDGGYSWFGAWWRSGFNSGNMRQRGDGEWGVYTGQTEFRYFESEYNVIATGVRADYDFGSWSGGGGAFRGTPWLNSPVGNAQISSKFLATRECKNCSKRHGGTDYLVPIGTKVVATASGTVSRSYYSRTYGNTVVIDHGPSYLGGGNVYTLYAHGKSLQVQEGQVVKTGSLIIYSGNSGKNTTGPHLHYEVIVTTLSPFKSKFFGDINSRYGPEALGHQLGY